jgi:hypothetical protein
VPAHSHEPQPDMIDQRESGSQGVVSRDEESVKGPASMKGRGPGDNDQRESNKNS